MTYRELADFIRNRMRMSHIYQPVMLMTLLKSRGICHEREIAAALLNRDDSQLEYYVNITNNMVGKVLRNHSIVTRDKDTRSYRLEDFENLTPGEVDTLFDLCRSRLEQFIEARGAAIFEHRRKSAGYISGTIRYEVLKRARFRCELCGISAEERALEVDHIVPRNIGGIDDPSNYQSLCYSCNAMKRDRDSTDFRNIPESYGHREKDCVFCNKGGHEIVSGTHLAYAIRDAYPVTDLHTLIIPKRHVLSYFELGQAEINACTKLINLGRKTIEDADARVTGFNIGINSGTSAGQTILHCHIHLIPRRDGDVERPKGGIRHVIPGKGFY